MADIGQGELARYRKALGKDRAAELARAVGLAAHGVGIGAYVYLRRVFESLVEEAHQLALTTSAGWDEKEYESSRMRERIQLLKPLLPPFLVEHPQLYNILSRGVHELAESECLSNFDALKCAITVILDERIEATRHEAQAEAARKALAAILPTPRTP
jgi:hypothetical protein